ncbi:ribonuclease P protein subunit p14 isoform X1 [Balaenoptera ricei]|uniref:ribonuclease P protein subunit p14 isoform X1 n=1 Tax=Balaenoptera ricei TaxID=2746895 RepID=UPI0028BE9275|nr:ribonuclease P protein subunit p14 isoform X1 [Balaenoptera ricei]
MTYGRARQGRMRKAEGRRAARSGQRYLPLRPRTPRAAGEAGPRNSPGLSTTRSQSRRAAERTERVTCAERMRPAPREFQDHGIGLNAAQFKQLLISALKDLFGEVDAALPLDILTYEEKTLSAILRICSSGLVKLWSSMTLLGSYKGKKCAFRVIQVSPFLLALSGNSRELVLN